MKIYLALDLNDEQGDGRRKGKTVMSKTTDEGIADSRQRIFVSD